MQIAIEDYQCYYQRNDKDENRYQYRVDWDDIIVSHKQLSNAIGMLRDTYKREAKRKKPIAIAVFVCEEDRSIEELAEDLE